MNILTLDFETYYDRDYTLSKMTTQEYILHDKFEVLMCGMQWNNDKPFILQADQIQGYLNQINWDTTALLCHNTMFDAAILNWRYGKIPAYLMDTMSMAQYLGFVNLIGSASLDRVSQYLIGLGYEMPNKGEEVVKALGKRREHFTETEWLNYQQYCTTDITITYRIYCILRHLVPDNEMAFQDMILRCYVQPMFRVHQATVEYELQRVREYQRNKLLQVCEQLGTTPDNLAAVLRSNDKFAELLRSVGGVTEADMERGVQGAFIIPTKVSATTGKTTWAFSKNDPEFKTLCDTDDEMVQLICDARIANKSSIAETRAERFLTFSKFGFLPIPYRIGGAHTNRLSGSDKFNAQNLPSGRKEGQSDLLRRSIIAPDGYVTVCYDSSQIECRTLNFIANQQDMVAVFATGGDPYSVMASRIFGLAAEEISHGAKVTKDPIMVTYRQIGKTVVLAAGYGQGARSFKNYCLTNAGLTITEQDAKRYIDTYRQSSPHVVRFWRECGRALSIMAQGGEYYFGGSDGRMFYATGNRVLLGRTVAGIRLPDGTWLNYPDLRETIRDRRKAYCFSKTGYNGKPIDTYVYDGLITENITQALAFAVMKYQALLINQRYPIKLNTHDEWAVVVPRLMADEAADYMHRVMSTPPQWLAGLPMASEGGWAQSYGAVDDKPTADNPDRVYVLKELS